MLLSSVLAAFSTQQCSVSLTVLSPAKGIWEEEVAFQGAANHDFTLLAFGNYQQESSTKCGFAYIQKYIFMYMTHAKTLLLEFFCVCLKLFVFLCIIKPRLSFQDLKKISPKI